MSEIHPKLFTHPPTARHELTSAELIARSKDELPVLTPEALRGVAELDTIGAAREHSAAVADAVVEIIIVYAGLKPAAVISERLIFSDLGTKNQTALFEAIIAMGIEVETFDIEDGDSWVAVSRYRELTEAICHGTISSSELASATVSSESTIRLMIPKTAQRREVGKCLNQGE